MVAIDFEVVVVVKFLRGEFTLGHLWGDYFFVASVGEGWVCAIVLRNAGECVYFILLAAHGELICIWERKFLPGNVNLFSETNLRN